MSGWTHVNRMTSSSGSSSSSAPAGQMNESRIPAQMPLAEALLIEFDTEPESDAPSTPNTNSNTDVRSRMDAIFAEVTASTSMTPLLSNMSIRQQAETVARPAASKPLPLPAASKPLPLPAAKKPANKHARFPANYPPNNSTVKIITTGRNMMALYGDETVPRTKNRLLVEDQYENGNVATAILNGRLTLAEICSDYPSFVSGTLLRVFSCEGWYPELIWKNLPSETRQVSEGDCPWVWLEEAANREKSLMAMAKPEGPVKKKMKIEEDDQSETPSDGSPSKNPGFNFNAPSWTLIDDAKLVLLKEHDKKGYKAIAEELGRSVSACTSRYSKLKKQREQREAAAAATVASAATAADNASENGQSSAPTALVEGSADVPMVVNGTVPLSNGQTDEAMVVD